MCLDELIHSDVAVGIIMLTIYESAELSYQTV